MHIRFFDERDYAGIVAVSSAVSPEYPENVEDYRHFDKTRDLKCKWGRLVCEEDGKIVAFGGFSHNAWSFHPRRFVTSLQVVPALRGRGIGADMFARLMTELKPLDPMLLTTDTREDRDYSIRFLEKRGFKEVMREQESVLDLTTFEPEDWREDLRRVEESGIEIRSYDDLHGDPALQQRLYDLDMELSKDVPMPTEFTERDFENYVERVFKGGRFYGPGYMIALDGDAMVGCSNFENPRDGKKLFTDLTGVKRAYRKRGLATALKVRALTVAKAAGYLETLTWNEENNIGMLGINKRLGFSSRPAWIEYHLVLDAKAVRAAEAAEAIDQK